MGIMVPSVHASAQARDITIDLQNSCNCCCFDYVWSRQNPQTQMYVNSEGGAERYDPKKAVDPQAALRRAVANLNMVIERNAKLLQKEFVVVRLEVAGDAQSSLEGVDAKDEVDAKTNSGGISISPNTTTWPITIDLIKRLNTVMKNVYDN